MTRLVFALLVGIAVLTVIVGVLPWREGKEAAVISVPTAAVLAGDSTAALEDLDSVVVEVRATRDIVEGAKAILSETSVEDLATRLRTKAELGLRHAGCRIVPTAPDIVVVHFGWYGQLAILETPYYSAWTVRTTLRRPVTRPDAPNQDWMESVWQQAETEGTIHEKAAILAAAEKAAQDQLDALVNAIEKRRAGPPARRRDGVTVAR